ncbi:MAG: Uma2 family endonuclease [Saprospiraceae bacterium]
MTSAAIQQHQQGGVPNGKPKSISWREFQKRYLVREDGHKYEWANGTVVKSRNMDSSQFYIVQNLLRLFESLRTFGKTTGMLIMEGDMFFGTNHRRPDMAFLTDEQIARTAHGENQVPLFVIEVISTNDQANLIHQKMENYRDAGVQVVWHISPQIGQIHLYTGKKLKQMTVCQGEDLSSAAPVLLDFFLSAADLLRKPAQP